MSTNGATTSEDRQGREKSKHPVSKCDFPEKHNLDKQSLSRCSSEVSIGRKYNVQRRRTPSLSPTEILREEETELQVISKRHHKIEKNIAKKTFREVESSLSNRRSSSPRSLSPATRRMRAHSQRKQRKATISSSRSTSREKTMRGGKKKRRRHSTSTSTVSGGGGRNAKSYSHGNRRHHHASKQLKPQGRCSTSMERCSLGAPPWNRGRGPPPMHNTCMHGAFPCHHATDGRPCPQPSKCVGIFGLNSYTSTEDVIALCAQTAPCEHATIIRDSHTQRSRGFAFAHFRSLEDARRVRNALNGKEFHNRRLRCDYSYTERPHSPTPGMYLGTGTRQFSSVTTYGGGGSDPKCNFSRVHTNGVEDVGSHRGSFTYGPPRFCDNSTFSRMGSEFGFGPHRTPFKASPAITGGHAHHGCDCGKERKVWVAKQFVGGRSNAGSRGENIKPY